MKKKYYSFRSRLGVIKADIEAENSVRPHDRLKMWKLGFTGDKYRLYKLDVNDHENYLSDHAAALTRFINYPYGIVLNDKILFEEIVGQYISVPKSYGFIEKGVIHPLQPSVDINNINSIIETCKVQGGLVVKPVSGAQGKGVVIIKAKDNKIFANNKRVNRNEIREFLSNLDNCIITEFIKQGEYANSLYQDSTNTMRIVAMMDPKTHKPFIARAAQRIGGKASGGLDNFSIGGYSANINVDTGVLSAAASKAGTEKLVWYDRHPDNNAPIKGVQVPRWDEIKSKLLNTMEALPYLKYVGWDVVLTDDDIVVIEGNNHPKPRVLQIHKPLLVDPKIRRFYEHHDVI